MTAPPRVQAKLRRFKSEAQIKVNTEQFHHDELLQQVRKEGRALRCVLVCTHKTFTKEVHFQSLD